MTERDTRERDILVAANEYAYVQDLTKGDIVLYVGPTKISLSNTERLVDYRYGRFVAVKPDDGGGVNAFVSAASSQYILLDNPTKDPTLKPIKGNNSAVDLRTGRKVVVPGPATFPLWPGQRARVVDGHALREDEYLVVRVYDDVEGDAAPIGTERIVRGTDTSFYVPRTGLEVVPHHETPEIYVRKAHHLKKGTGIHLRVAKAFEATASDQVPEGRYEAGQDLFLPDREGYFFPTSSLEVIAQVAAIPLAEREGLYVRDIASGLMSVIVGPVNYLPDPTRIEIVPRSLTDERADLYRIAAHEEGRAFSVQVPSGFAVLVTTAKGRREVVRGPQTRILDHDEDLEVLELSTGKPKTSERRLRTCFLQTEGNKVSDVLRLKTADHNEVEVAVSYRVSFVAGDATRWFNVEDYVGLLCDHAASILRGAVRASSIEMFYQNSTEILRTAILGEKREGVPRVGRTFEENGMWIYDLEVLDMQILDPEVNVLIGGAQRNAIVADVMRRQELLRLETEKLKEEVHRAILGTRIETMIVERSRVDQQRAVDLASVEAKVAIDLAAQVGDAKAKAEALGVSEAARMSAREREDELDRKSTETRVAAFREQMAAIHPELVATLKTLGHQQLTTELAKQVGPLAILGGESVTDVIERLLGSLPIGASTSVKQLLGPKNGKETAHK